MPTTSFSHRKFKYDQNRGIRNKSVNPTIDYYLLNNPGNIFKIINKTILIFLP
jgi:hypothetical protein